MNDGWWRSCCLGWRQPEWHVTAEENWMKFLCRSGNNFSSSTCDYLDNFLFSGSKKIVAWAAPRVNIQMQARPKKKGFRLFSILIIHKHAVTCGHKLIIIDVRLDHSCWPGFVFVLLSRRPHVSFVDWPRHGKCTDSNCKKCSINNIRRNSFFCWIIGSVCLVGNFKFNSRIVFCSFASRPGWGVAVGVIDVDVW